VHGITACTPYEHATEQDSSELTELSWNQCLVDALVTGILCTCMLEHWAVHCIRSLRASLHFITNTSTMYAKAAKISIELAPIASLDRVCFFCTCHVICIAPLVEKLSGRLLPFGIATIASI
jgi:hypothetical protein